ncbi:MAG TPA: hypothetical protein VLF71_04665 [Candidatus Saccharimonadales bacterium]|nr:hypothetical protein [Candidatus Saccharimonadales bacterium]
MTELRAGELSAAYANPAGFNPENGYPPGHPEFARLVGHLATFPDGATHALSSFGGAGKSTIAASLARHGYQIVSYDAFYTGQQDVVAPDWETYDAAALIAGVLEPLAAGQPGEYTPRDWITGEKGEPVVLDPSRPTVVEGVGLLRPDVRGRFTGALVWVDRPLDLAMRDGIARGGDPGLEKLWRKYWGPSDEAFFHRHDPRAQATFLFDRRGDGDGPHSAT